ARARRIGATELFLDGADEIVAMARLFRDQGENDEPQVAMAEDPAGTLPEAAAAEARPLAEPAAAATPASAGRRAVLPFMPAPAAKPFAPPGRIMMSSKHAIYLSLHI